MFICACHPANPLSPPIQKYLYTCHPDTPSMSLSQKYICTYRPANPSINCNPHATQPKIIIPECHASKDIYTKCMYIPPSQPAHVTQSKIFICVCHPVCPLMSPNQKYLYEYVTQPISIYAHDCHPSYRIPEHVTKSNI